MRKTTWIACAIVLFGGILIGFFYKGNRVRITGGTVTLYSATYSDKKLHLEPFHYEKPEFMEDWGFAIVGIKFDYEFYFDGNTYWPHIAGCDGFGDSITELDFYWYDAERKIKDEQSNKYDAFEVCQDQICIDGDCSNEPCFGSLHEFMTEYNSREDGIQAILGNEFYFSVGFLKHGPRIEGTSLSDPNLVIQMELKFSDDRSIILPGKR